MNIKEFHTYFTEFADNVTETNLIEDVQYDLSKGAFYSEIMPLIETSYQEYMKNPLGFNIWEGMGLSRDEVKNCSFLRYLLDPMANHGQRDLFLKCFLKLPQINGTEFFKETPLNEIHVNTEEYVDSDSRIDISIRSKRHIILIEAKIDATEQPKQLERYEIILNRTAVGTANKRLIFLTFMSLRVMATKVTHIYGMWDNFLLDLIVIGGIPKAKPW